jgi:hypothetical protein
VVTGSTTKMIKPLNPVSIEDEPDEDCNVCDKEYWACLVHKKAPFA